jgi:hypothetical protein
MLAGDLLDLFRDEMNDTVEPYLWGDTAVLTYIDDAQKMFCRLTDGISDVSTPAITQLAITTGAQWYATDPRILKIREASRADTGRDVMLVNRENMAQRQMRFDGHTGPIQALVIGMEAHKVRTWPVPSEAVTIELMVFRLPMETITDVDQAFEIDEQHHLHLLDWAKARAYGKQDSEAFDKTKYVEFEGRFLAYCEQVKQEIRRSRHTPRTVAYGGI